MGVATLLGLLACAGNVGVSRVLLSRSPSLYGHVFYEIGDRKSEREKVFLHMWGDTEAGWMEGESPACDVNGN